ncbi:toll/interleukin-1 receptor domain-containing protein [Salmonella enterica subsp. enterica]|uniref:toll/interleukin-1 receptor domain-containing protein n=1 Tax=Salmonella enterica TaxID=28901 RepID=UPI0009AF4EC6|nr:toll/interleukin-1 receptor domain-containing protein [Salmonella enterica]EBR0226366.1 toll/interleukin-1 receptor domain-containing protein [Salmonella enterica subsp. enterica serovar Monschaui]ECD2235347.1 toll/interleukin-1 receptor domain-containing protein [Salmonella enterica subsp. enterica serovar Offa]ECK7273970.1 toll/interleukin-1 receptor domain-containing protein [Salmonella enterica subsp. enterica serovar Budapest]EJQ0064554.1 toll/interleukin-1 receptor domain-containing pr
MTNVFISYAREDVLIARKLTEELSRYGYNIFLDQQSIRLGSHWQEDMIKNLKMQMYLSHLLLNIAISLTILI